MPRATMRGCVFVTSDASSTRCGQVVGLLGEALAGRRAPGSGRRRGRRRAARAGARRADRLAGAARRARARAAPRRRRRSRREGARGGLAGGQIAAEITAAEVRLRRRAEPLRDLHAPGLAGGVQAHDGFQRRRNQVGERAADGDVGQRRQVAPDRRDRRGGRRRPGDPDPRPSSTRVEPGLGLEVGEAGVERGVDLGGIAPGVDADALARKRPGRIVRRRRRTTSRRRRRRATPCALIERRVERVVRRRGDDPQRAPPRRQAERAREIVAGVRDRPHRQRARLQRRQVVSWTRGG